MVLEEATPLRESHDIGVLLQHKIEALPSVERCFVHIDYQHRVHDDHDLATPVVHKIHASVSRGESIGSACGSDVSDVESSSLSGAPLLPRRLSSTHS